MTLRRPRSPAKSSTQNRRDRKDQIVVLASPLGVACIRKTFCGLCVFALSFWAARSTAIAQPSLAHRGFVESRGIAYAQRTDNDSERLAVDLLAREEVEWRPVTLLRLAASLDARADTDDRVEDGWRLDFGDRTIRRPRLAVRRLDATFSRRGLSLDIGKQFVRWGRADLLNPTDRFAPRDYLEVTDSEFLAVSGARAVYERGAHTFDGVWVPRATPSRIPLLDHRWAVVPAEARQFTLIDRGANDSAGAQYGFRYAFVGSQMEASLALYDGVNHLPFIDVRPSAQPFALDVSRRLVAMRMVGGDAAVPLTWMTLKGELGYFRTSDSMADDYVQYVIQAERQIGEWSLVGGYAGEVVTTDRTAALDFAPDRGLARTLLGRASYTIDVNRSASLEGAIRQDGRGSYLRGEYSQARGAHWRATVRGTLIRGDAEDFLGQYRRNSHLSIALRYSF